MARMPFLICWLTVACVACGPLPAGGQSQPPRRLEELPPGEASAKPQRLSPTDITDSPVRPAAVQSDALPPAGDIPSDAAVAEPPASRRSERQPALPLSPPEPHAGDNRVASTAGTIFSVLGALGVVLGVFLLVVWVFRRTAPKSAGLLPAEVVEVLGRRPLAPRQFVHLLRLGNKLILVSITPGGAETLAEVDDPVEVDRLAGLCSAAQSSSTTGTFRQIFEQFGKEPASRAFVNQPDKPKSRRLPATNRSTADA